MPRHSSDSRRSSDQAPPPPHNPNVFDDEYALDPTEEEDLDFVPMANGFRPGAWDGNHGDRPEHDPSAPSRPPLNSAHSTDSTDLRRLASHNSIAKAPYGRDSISHDFRNTGTHDSRGPSSMAAGALQRNASISSTASLSTMAPSEDPFSNGPSHPYGMYPQNPVARSESLISSSTQRRSQYPMPLQGPAHPYAMYPQNYVDDGPPLPPAQVAPPAGFPGHNAGYHRRVGPDGEEQDIIGPDGHTEQLPPYTRYPEQGPTKASLAAQESATPIVGPILTLPHQSNDTLQASPVSPISPLSPEELLPPEQEPLMSNITPITPAVVRQHLSAPTPATLSETTLSASERGGMEKMEMTGSAKPWRSRKLWGRVPVGVVAIILLLMLILAIVLGAALGTMVAKKQNKEKDDGGDGSHDDKHHEEPSAQVTGPHNTLFDAIPIPTPTGMVPLPIGVYALPLGMPQESSKNCLPVLSQLPAWSCQMTFAPLVLSINYTGTEVSQPIASVGIPSTMPPDGRVQLGVQPPNLGSNPMQLVKDLDFLRYGPAYHFSSFYDKVVVLSQDDFVAGASLVSSWKRGNDNKPAFRHRFQASAGDTPWYCHWDSTYIEGYVYVDNNSTAATFTNFPTAWPSSTQSSSATIPIETAAPRPSLARRQPPYNDANGIPTPVSSDFKRFVPYPRIVKIEERRLPGSPKPYCQMMRLLEDFSVVEAVDQNNVPIRVELEEMDPTMEEFLAPDTVPTSVANAMKRHEANLKERGDPADACHCQWMFQ